MTGSSTAAAADSPPPFPGQATDWNGYDQYKFELQGKTVIVVAPESPAAGRPWVWHGEFFGHKPAPDIALLGKGFHIVALQIPDQLGGPSAVQDWNMLYAELTTKYGFSRKPALVGLSRGGLYCYNWATANPDKVACIYGDAPVCDFKSWPGGKGKGPGSDRDWKLVLDRYGFKNDAEAIAYDKNPVDQLASLAKANVPLLHVYGDADEVVPWDENTGLLAERYRELGGLIYLIVKPGVKHHPHGLEDSTPIVEFIARNAGAISQPADIDEAVQASAIPFWEAQRLKESFLFVQASGQDRPSSRFLFKPQRVVAVNSAARDFRFDEGKDYIVEKETGRITLPVGSRIPFLTAEQLQPLTSSKTPKIGRMSGDKSRGVFFDNRSGYHRLQVEVTYDCDPSEWKGPRPASQATQLPRLMSKLRNKEPIKLFLSGDSISEGYNASKFSSAPPGQPAYGELVALALQKKFGSSVQFKNFAVGGWSSGRGLQQVKEENLGSQKPDLVIVAYGMNDVFGKNAADYQKNIREIISGIRAQSPETEFLLVATMVGNRDWGMPMEQFAPYREAVRELCGPGIVMADLTTLWEALLERKSFYDLTGNGVNHPNDFGHQIYAQVLLATLGATGDRAATNVTSAATDSPAKKPVSSLDQQPVEPMQLLKKSKRLVFLGDSITAAGEYVAGFEAWLLTQPIEARPYVLNLGLPSETVSGLSEEGHANGQFPRPTLTERLDRVLETTKPDLIVACYGMNCGIYQPFSEERLAKYKAGIELLRKKAAAIGATVIHITPPTYDDQRGKNKFSYNEVLGKYSDWLLSQRQAGWIVVDLHGPMTKELEQRRKADANFTFQPDAVHPNEEGSWYVASQLIKWFGDEAASRSISPVEMLKSKKIPAEVMGLVRKRMFVLRDAFVAKAGHLRPGVAKGLPLPEAEEQAEAIKQQILKLMEKGSP